MKKIVVICWLIASPIHCMEQLLSAPHAHEISIPVLAHGILVPSQVYILKELYKQDYLFDHPLPDLLRLSDPYTALIRPKPVLAACASTPVFFTLFNIIHYISPRGLIIPAYEKYLNIVVCSLSVICAGLLAYDSARTDMYRPNATHVCTALKGPLGMLVIYHALCILITLINL